MKLIKLSQITCLGRERLRWLKGYRKMTCTDSLTLTQNIPCDRGEGGGRTVYKRGDIQFVRGGRTVCKWAGQFARGGRTVCKEGLKVCKGNK